MEDTAPEFHQDEGELQKIFDSVRDKHYPELNCLELQYVFRMKEKMHEGQLVYGSAEKISPRDRDLYGYDARVCIHKESWDDLNRSGKRKLAFHELMHFRLTPEDKAMPADEHNVKKDKAGRICYTLRPHDFSLMRFTEELEKFGLSDTEEYVRLELNRIHELHQEKKDKKKSTKTKKSKTDKSKRPTGGKKKKSKK